MICTILDLMNCVYPYIKEKQLLINMIITFHHEKVAVLEQTEMRFSWIDCIFHATSEKYAIYF